MKIVLIVSLATQALPAVLAFCCGSEGDGHLHYCGDYTAPTPCCATGSCNIFCCACEGVCRGSSKLLLKRNPGEVSFSLADSAGNGNLTLDRELADSAKAASLMTGACPVA